MALPSIVLLLAYAGAVFLAVTEALGSQGNWGFLRIYSGWPAFVGGLVTTGATAVHYWRFRVPITIAAGMAALVAAIVGLFFALAPGFADNAAMPLLLLCGLAVFTLAMRFDLSDPQTADAAHRYRLLAAYAGGAPHRSSTRQRPDR